MRSGLRASGWAWARLAGSLALAATAACNERDRLTFPTPGGPGSDGPVTIIDVPSGDTTVGDSATYFLTGYTTDDDGVDTVYFETNGGVSTFPPFVGSSDSVRFGLPITTAGQAGKFITVRVFGTDERGNRGDTAIRVITVE